MFDNCFHYSSKLITPIRKRNYEARLWHTYVKHNKPHGLWLTFEYPDDNKWAGEYEGSWYHICMSHRSMRHRVKYKYRVILNKDAKLIIITNEKELDDFSDAVGFWKRYVPDHPLEKVRAEEKKIKEALNPLTDMSIRQKEKDNRIIDWIYVYGLYDGIIINPWIESKKNSYLWYSGWECASGCIWGLKAIDTVELVND